MTITSLGSRTQRNSRLAVSAIASPATMPPATSSPNCIAAWPALKLPVSAAATANR